ncbi:MAG: CRISPR-associated ring nuclease [Chloroflexota bacterium]|nr:CRISPR-associated ring nuclease [Chloroflexota bacterium]
MVWLEFEPYGIRSSPRLESETGVKQSSAKSALICTLGAQPQVVTLSLDLLRGQGRWVDELIVIHTNPDHEPIFSSLESLKLELSRRARPAAGFVTVKDDSGLAIDDLSTASEAAAFLRALYRTVLQLKQAGVQVDLNLSGGRKSMSIYALVVAQLLFEEGDKVWYLLSSDAMRASGRMTLQPGDDATLLEIPVLRWSSVSPAATSLGAFDDPWDAIAFQQEHHLRGDLAARRVFVNQVLTPAERAVARLAATSGKDNDLLAAEMHKSPKTIANQLTSVYAKLHEFLGYRDDVPTDRAVLAAELGTCFALEDDCN